jgi:hypothetical protein
VDEVKTKRNVQSGSNVIRRQSADEDAIPEALDEVEDGFDEIQEAFSRIRSKVYAAVARFGPTQSRASPAGEGL